MIFGIFKPYPSPLISGRGIDLDFPMLAGCLALLGLGGKPSEEDVEARKDLHHPDKEGWH